MAVIELENLQIGTTEEVITVTSAAANTIRNLMEQRQIPDHALRVFVSGGGCSGMQYGMAFEAGPQEQDYLLEVEGVRLLIDSTSLIYLQGATIDFVDSLMGGGFRIDNPNAASSCGCGHSFKAKGSSDSASDAGGCGTCSSH